MIKYKLAIKFIKKFIKKSNLFDFIFQTMKTKPSSPMIKKLAEISTGGDIPSILKKLINQPDLLAKELSSLNPQELAKLSEAIAKARFESGTQDGTTGTQSQALSSSWLIFGIYTPISENQGLIQITTIQGKSYSFPKPLKLATWERMKMAQGRNGTGAGQIFHDEYWSKIRKSQVPKPGVATVFKLLELRKKQANKVVRLTKKALKKGRA